MLSKGHLRGQHKVKEEQNSQHKKCDQGLESGMKRMMINVVSKYYQDVFISPGIRGLDADEGAGDDLNVAKKGGYPNNDYLMKLIVKMVSMMMDVVMVTRKRMMMVTRMK